MEIAEEFMSPQKIKSAKTKQKIFDAMCELLTNYGYESITVANICKKANVTTGAFYHHYKGKDDLISLYLNEDYLKYVNSHGDLSAKSPLLRFLDYCTFGSLHKNQISADFLSHFFSTQNKSLATYGLTPEQMKISQNYFDRYQALEDSQKSGDIKEDVDLIKLNEDTCSITKGITFDWCLSEGSFDLGQRIKRIVSNYMKPYVTDKGLQDINSFMD